MKMNRKSKLLLVSLSVVALLAATGSLIYALLADTKPATAISMGDPVAASRSYVGKVIQAKAAEPVVENGKIKLRLSVVDQWSLVRFDLANDEGNLVPIMAYITSSGRLYAGDALCACGCSDFFLAGKVLVCDDCRSTYDIENQKYLSGPAICEIYPPTSMHPIVEDGWIVIEQSKVLAWRNRIANSE